MIGRKFLFSLALAASTAVLPARVPAAAAVAAEADPAKDLNGYMRYVVAQLCVPEVGGPVGLTHKLEAILVDGVRPIQIGDNTVGWRAKYRLRSGDELRARQQGLDEKVQTLTMDYYRKMPISGELRPLMTVVANSDCKIVNGRRLRYDDEEQQDRLIFFGPGLEAMAHSEPLNPPVPPGRDVWGQTVAHFDAGINYTLPKLAGRLARAPNGQPLGYDFWDMDSRPFDSNPVRSPFYPLRHGTQVAGVIVDEAPGVRLLPYRYPRPDMSRMGAMVRAADENGATIVAMPMGSNKREDWDEFLKAVSERPHMLFVISAGNDGRDIDAQPVYPAMLGLENFLVVTSSTPFGRLAPGSNWGAKSVDIMVPAENVPMTTFYGDAGRGSGSSYAVARVAALAARLLRAHPGWKAPELKAAILERAQPLPENGKGVVRHGWIPDPVADG